LSISRLALALVVIAAPASAASPDVGCARCIVVDDEENVLWSRNPRDRYPNASTTKMVTALLVSRATDPSDLVTVSTTAGSIGGGGLDLSPGETYTVDALMYALLLDSSNEAAQALAEHVAGSGAVFVKKMNDYVAGIGATRTRFSNPHGLDAEGHYSSARDLATIAARVLADPYLARIVRTRRATIATPGGRTTLDNRNLLLETYPGAIGVKTGRTLGAGNVLVAAARRNGRTVVAVAMNSYDSFADSAALLDYGFAELRRLSRRGTLVEEGETIGELVFDSGSTPVIAGSSLEGLLPSRPGTIRFTIVAAPAGGGAVTAGGVVGTARVETDRGVAGTIPIIAVGSVPDQDEDPWWAAPLVGLVSLVGGVVA